MNATSLTLAYLWHETRARWREQPSSPLMRLALSATLTGAASWFWLGSAAQEAALSRELARLGFDTAVIQAPAVAPLADDGVPYPPDHWAAALAGRGDVRLLQTVPLAATAAAGEPLAVYVTSWARLSAIIPPATGASAVWISRSQPAGRKATVWLDGAPEAVVTITPEGLWSALGTPEALLVPPALVPSGTAAGAAGRMDVVLFRPTVPGDTGGPLAAVRTLFAANHESPPVIEDPSPRWQAFARLRALSRGWRLAVLGLLGGCVLLMFTTVGVLEERQTRFTQALLRSLGAPQLLVWGASLVENLLLANAALGLAALALRGAPAAFAAAGLPAAAIALPASAWITLAAVLNAGVLLSLLPLALALRRPVGIVLP